MSTKICVSVSVIVAVNVLFLCYGAEPVEKVGKVESWRARARSWGGFVKPRIDRIQELPVAEAKKDFQSPLIDDRIWSQVVSNNVCISPIQWVRRLDEIFVFGPDESMKLRLPKEVIAGWLEKDLLAAHLLRHGEREVVLDWFFEARDVKDPQMEYFVVANAVSFFPGVATNTVRDSELQKWKLLATASNAACRKIALDNVPNWCPTNRLVDVLSQFVTDNDDALRRSAMSKTCFGLAPAANMSLEERKSVAKVYLDYRAKTPLQCTNTDVNHSCKRLERDCQEQAESLLRQSGGEGRGSPGTGN